MSENKKNVQVRYITAYNSQAAIHKSLKLLNTKN